MRPAPIALATLKRRADFLRVANAGMKWGSAVLVVQASKAVDRKAIGEMRAEPGAHSRRTRSRVPTICVGFTASRKVGGAVQRSLAKRRMRAIAREVLPAEAKPDFDYVLIARPATLTCEFAKLRAELRQALRRLKLLRPAADTVARA